MSALMIVGSVAVPAPVPPVKPRPIPYCVAAPTVGARLPATLADWSKGARLYGWALRGLANALAAEGRDAEARVVEAQFQQAWTHATISITASAF